MPGPNPRVPLFSFDRVSIRRDGHWLLREFTAVIPGSGVTAVVGPSGSGKTTLLRLCNRLEVPDSGAVSFLGRPLSEVEVLAHRRRVGLVFQQPVLFGGTVRDNFRVARPDADDPELRAAVDEVGLPAEVLEAQAGRLSTGEAQRVCLARTLVTGPAVLLLDEPTSALDPGNRLAFEELILRLVDGSGSTGGEPVPTVWVTHDHDQVHRVADQVLAVEAGRPVYAGPPDRFAPDPEPPPTRGRNGDRDDG